MEVPYVYGLMYVMVCTWTKYSSCGGNYEQIHREPKKETLDGCPIDSLILERHHKYGSIF